MVAETLLAFWTPGPGEIILIAVVMLVVFGNRIPEVMRSLGRGLSQFKKGIRDTEVEVRRQFDMEGNEAGKQARDDPRDDPDEKDGAQAALPGGRERE